MACLQSWGARDECVVVVGIDRWMEQSTHGSPQGGKKEAPSLPSTDAAGARGLQGRLRAPGRRLQHDARLFR